MKCDKCRASFDREELRPFHSQMLCDDCYISAIWPKVRKTYYNGDPGEFMHRLKKSYSIIPQRYH
ncbi:MAG: hypothetical protein GY846_18180 [Deltaproteobacteria bacterium]|nr:hypothetical protein [Deltaproteobacteria bacterium]